MTFGCDEATRYIDPWVDGELDPSAAVHVEAHLAKCCACRGEADAVKRLKKAMAGLREDSAPTALRFRLTAALDAVDAQHDHERSAVKRRRNAVGMALTGAALAGVVLAQGLRVRSLQTRTEALYGSASPAMAGMLPVVSDLAQRHARELPLEVEASDPAEVAQWFRGKLDIPVRPVLFRGMPARLVGARISDVRSHLAAALYYDVGGRRVTVFVFDGSLLPRAEAGPHDTAIIDGRPCYVGSSHGYTVTLTEQQGVGYAIASDLPAQENVRFVASAELR